MAVTTGNLDIIHLILQHLLSGGVSIQSMETIFPPVAFAVLFDHEHIIQYLLEKSFQINCKMNYTGLTPLMFAAVNENIKLMNLLASKGADLNAKNINHQSARDIMKLKWKRIYSQQSQQMHQQCLPPSLSPLVYLSPQPCMHLPQNQVPRRSSNLDMSPNYFFSQNVAPVTPISFIPQVFFPPDFSPNIYMSPANSNYYANEMLNARLNRSAFLSQMSPNYSVFNSPYQNVHY